MIKKLIYLSILILISVKTYAQEMYKVSEKLNVRVAENPKSKIIGYIPSGENVAVLDSANSKYFKIKVINGVGFVDSKFLTKIQKVEQDDDAGKHNLMIVIITVGLALFLVLCYYIYKANSRKYALIILTLLLCCAAGYFGYAKLFNREVEAIALVQQSKYEYSNPLEAFMFGINAVNATNLDFANLIAQKDKSTRYFWEAEKKEDDIYLVSFMDNKKSGQHWEVDLKNKIIKYVNNDKYLHKKYMK